MSTEIVTDATIARDAARVSGKFGSQPAHLPEASVELVEPKLSGMQKALAKVPGKADDLIRQNPEAALALFQALAERMSEAKFKPLRQVTVHDDGETFRGVRCPHCSTLLEADDLEALEYDTYTIVVDDLDADDGSVTVRRDHDDDSGYAPLCFKTTCCDRPVSLGDLREYR